MLEIEETVLRLAGRRYPENKIYRRLLQYSPTLYKQCVKLLWFNILFIRVTVKLPELILASPV